MQKVVVQIQSRQVEFFAANVGTARVPSASCDNHAELFLHEAPLVEYYKTASAHR
jgi:hypothetical protein